MNSGGGPYQGSKHGKKQQFRDRDGKPSYKGDSQRQRTAGEPHPKYSGQGRGGGRGGYQSKAGHQDHNYNNYPPRQRGGYGSYQYRDGYDRYYQDDHWAKHDHPRDHNESYSSGGGDEQSARWYKKGQQQAWKSKPRGGRYEEEPVHKHSDYTYKPPQGYNDYEQQPQSAYYPKPKSGWMGHQPYEQE